MTPTVDTRAPAGPSAGFRRPVGMRAWAVVAAAAGAGALALGLWAGDGTAVTALPGLPTPGRSTTWGLPVARVVLDVASFLTVGLLLAVAVLLPPAPDGLSARSQRALRRAGWLAAVWAVAAAASILLTFSDFLGQPLGESLGQGQLASFTADTAQGRALFLQVVLAAGLAAASRWVLDRGGALVLLLVALATVALPATTGHAGSADDHTLAQSSLVVHIVAASLWVGGLIALAVLVSHGPKALAVAVPRFSKLALWCVVAIALSGVANAAVRLDSLGQLGSTAYGRLVLAKTVALLVLAAVGAAYRRRILPASSAGGWGTFLRVAAAEGLLMVATVGIAVALSRTATPVPENEAQDLLTPAREVLGYPLPPEPTLGRLLFDVRVDGWMLTGALIAAALYLTGVRVLARRGDRWQPGRTVAWLAGLALLGWVTSGGLGVYGPVLFSAHMSQHMLLTMAVPILLVLGAPATLALRSVRPASRGGTGAREVLLSFLHSRFVRVLSNPLLATAIFVGSLFGLYFSPLFPAAMDSHWGHLAMQVHFLLAGSLFFWVLIGIDPGPRRLPHLARLVVLFVAMSAHAFFSIALLSSNEVLAESYFSSLERPYRISLLDDQHLGGGIGWAFGELPIVAVIGALLFSWVRSDAREAARSDRRADADGDSDLEAANARFAALADRDRRGTR